MTHIKLQTLQYKTYAQNQPRTSTKRESPVRLSRSTRAQREAKFYFPEAAVGPLNLSSWFFILLAIRHPGTARTSCGVVIVTISKRDTATNGNIFVTK